MYRSIIRVGAKAKPSLKLGNEKKKNYNQIKLKKKDKIRVE